jgi:hypothetical protein
MTRADGRRRQSGRLLGLLNRAQGGLGGSLRQAFYFGCEADDRVNARAFSKHAPFGAKLHVRVNLWDRQNPRCFEGTAVAKAAAEALGSRSG